MKFIPIILLLCFFFIGCSSSVSPKTAVENALYAQIDSFYQAVLDKNSDKVYSYISSDLGNRFNKQSFHEYFIQHYPIFLEYAESIKDNHITFSISSQPEGDICGTLLMEPDENGNWKLSNLPEKLASQEAQKQYILKLVQSNIFSAALNEYGVQHPELTGASQRVIRRSVQSAQLSDIHFSGNQVVIDLPGTAVLRMECASKAWRLVQCSLLH